MILKTDFLGREVTVGDKVIFVQKGYRNLMVGEIIKMAEKTALIKHAKTNTCSTETRQFYCQIVKIVE